MRLCITKIKQRPVTAQSYQLVDTSIDPARFGYHDFVVDGDVAFDGRVTNKGEGIFEVDGTYQTRLKLNCSRCLTPFELPVCGEIHALYGSSAEEDADGELTVRSFSGEEIELDELLLSEINFALPMQPLCREDCRGLCPECGTNLNNGACTCAKETIDPRWEKLAYFKFNGNE